MLRPKISQTNNKTKTIFIATMDHFHKIYDGSNSAYRQVFTWQLNSCVLRQRNLQTLSEPRCTIQTCYRCFTRQRHGTKNLSRNNVHFNGLDWPQPECVMEKQRPVLRHGGTAHGWRNLKKFAHYTPRNLGSTHIVYTFNTSPTARLSLWWQESVTSIPLSDNQ